MIDYWLLIGSSISERDRGDGLLIIIDFVMREAREAVKSIRGERGQRVREADLCERGHD